MRIAAILAWVLALFFFALVWRSLAQVVPTPLHPSFVGFAYQATAVDGDTIRVSVDVWPNVSARDERIRLVKIDTPEVHAKTQCERDLATKATAHTRQRLLGARLIQINVEAAGRDSFGRVLGEVFLDGISLNDELLVKGFARPYSAGAKIPWC